jgi:hypothetical protein
MSTNDVVRSRKRRVNRLPILVADSRRRGRSGKGSAIRPCSLRAICARKRREAKPRREKERGSRSGAEGEADGEEEERSVNEPSGHRTGPCRCTSPFSLPVLPLRVTCRRIFAYRSRQLNLKRRRGRSISLALHRAPLRASPSERKAADLRCVRE